MGWELLKNPIRINSWGKWHCDPDYYWDTSQFGWKDHCLWMVCGGRGESREGDKIYTFQTGDCFLFRGTSRYITRALPGPELLVIAFHFDFLFPNGKPILPTGKNVLPFFRKIPRISFFIELLNRFLEAKQGGREEKNALVWARAIFEEVCQVDLLPRVSTDQVDYGLEIEKVCTRIREGPEKSYPIATMARRLGLSPDHFTRVFRKVKGVTPKNFILTARLEGARSLLRSSSYSVTRIAEVLGYRDVFFFVRQFRNKTGLTPTQYRKG